jgi:hypothetical protein
MRKCTAVSRLISDCAAKRVSSLTSRRCCSTRAKAIGKIQGHYADGEVDRDIPLSRTALGKGAPFILHGHIQDDRQAIRFDGLKKVDGASIIGEFHYEPVMFSESRRVLKAERQLLAMFAIILSRIQGKVPSSGVLYLGRDCSLTTVRFGATGECQGSCRLGFVTSCLLS